MASVWKRLQRVNKRAAKFQYTASYHRVDLDTSPKWKPNKLSVVWTRRSRRVITEPLEWEPSLKDPLKGSVLYTLPENHTVAVTLFKDSRTNELEDKDWTFVLEDVSSSGKRRRLAVCSINMRKYASLEPSQRALALPLAPTTHKVTAATLHLTLHCVLLREGQATDEDMQSLASLLSVNNNSDVAVLEDLDEDDYTLSDHSTRQMLDFRQQMEEMTQSLTNSDIAATPNSVQSLTFDPRTPTQPNSPFDAAPPSPERTPTENPEDIVFKPLKPEPKFTSTPKGDDKLEGFKGVVFKPKTVAKRNLKPLELKTNLNNLTREEEDSDKTPTANHYLAPPHDKDKTPVQDLLEWCQAATREYRAVALTDLTASFRSGLAFCAIIHNFRPDLIDFSGLQPDESEKNVRTALDASAALGISQVLTVGDVCSRPAPDRLAIMTYLFQLRAHFTGNELQVEQLGSDECESVYLVGRHDTDGSLPRELFSREVSARRSARHMPPIERPSPEPASPSINHVKDLLHQSKSLLGKMVSPGKDPRGDTRSTKWFTDPLAVSNEPPPVRPEKLMTRKELTDPFGSDEEDDPPPGPIGPPGDPPTNGNVDTAKPPEQRLPEQRPPEGSPPPSPGPHPADLPKPTPQLLSRHDELKERARQLLEATRREAREKDRLRRQNSKEKEESENMNGLRNGDASPKKPMTEEERQTMLRERARKLIADARAGIVSPTSPLSPSRQRGTVEIISKHSLMEEIAKAGGVEQLDAYLARSEPAPDSPASRQSSLSPDHSEDRQSSESGCGRSPLLSFSALVDRLSPEHDTEKDGDADGDESGSGGSYIAQEVAALEREQRAVDERAAALEKQLRRVMEQGRDEQEEDRLMAQWFNLVNKKNALLRRQMQLNILEQEEDLSRRCELLARELRLSLAVDEWRKTPGQKRRERLLLQELLSAVNERDRLVQEMDEQEKAIADDDEIERTVHLGQVSDMQRKNNCILQ